MEFLDKLSGRTLLLVIGVGSAFVGLVVNTEIRTFWQRVSFMVGGVICCVFLTGPISRYFGVTDTDYQGAIGFALGIFGMSLLQRTKAYVDSLDIIAIIRARLFPGVKP